MPWDVREKEGKFCVYKKGTDDVVPGGCHSERADAVKHMKALYAAEPNATTKYSVLTFSASDLIDTEVDNIKWLRAWRYSTWDHPVYGKVEVTPELGQAFKEHFDAKSLGREHLLTYEHGLDPAKGYKAGGRILNIDPREDGIYYQVEFNEIALNEVKNGEWYYLSPEYDDAYIDGESGEVFENLPLDLTLTNSPYFKGQSALPLNFSELIIPKKETKGGNKVDDLLKKVFAELGVELDDDADEDAVIAAAKDLNSTIEPLRKAKSSGEKNRAFREAFPDEWKEMEKLREARVEGEARAFSDDYRRFTITVNDTEYKSSLGFSETVIEAINETYKKFSTKNATPADLKAVLDLIANHGVVDYAEHGSSRSGGTREFSEDPKLAFSEAVQSVMDNDNLDYEAAITVAKSKHPDLYENYLKAVPQR